MGNKMCASREQEDNQMTRILVSRMYHGLSLQIIHGNPNDETTELLVKFVLDQQQFNLNEGDITVQPQFDRSVPRSVMFCRVPYYMDTLQLNTYYKVYTKILQSTNAKTITFEDASSLKNPIPKQFNAEILIRAIINHINEANERPSIIKIVSPIIANIKFIQFELEKVIEEQLNPEVAMERNLTFMKFINPTQSFLETVQNEVEYNKVHRASLVSIGNPQEELSIRNSQQNDTYQ